jgi:hypothetical protein
MTKTGVLAFCARRDHVTEIRSNLGLEFDLVALPAHSAKSMKKVDDRSLDRKEGK